MLYKSADKTQNSGAFNRAAALVCGAASLIAAVIFLLVPAVKYARAGKLAGAGDSAAAYEIYEALGGYRDSETLADGCLAELCSRAVAERDYALFNEYYALIAGDDAKEAARASALETGEALYGAGLYEIAYDCFSALSSDGEAESAAERCRAARYRELLEEYESSGRVPEGFGGDMLKGYLDCDSYAVFYELQNSPWKTGDEAEEIALLYSLGDFLSLRESGFITQRLYGNSYSNAGGYYFRTGKSGDWEYNLPHTKYLGYYGLYTKFNGNVLLTGSDEKQFWVEQFRFEFSDYDRTLSVYCFATGGTITLSAEA